MDRTPLKTDLFGTVTKIERRHGDFISFAVERNWHHARWWLRGLAARLATRELRALLALEGIPGIPILIDYQRGILIRSWIDAAPMQRAQPTDARYYREALRLLRRLHRAGVAHNDLGKEPNWLVTHKGLPALVDFQLALVSPRRGRFFRMLARDDLRHLFKHKRTYCPHLLTHRQRHILATPSALSRLWMKTGKPIYIFITRKLLRWADREGAGDRRFGN